MPTPQSTPERNATVLTADVGIIGAGPAGLATAVRLGQLGVGRVVIVDRMDFPRDKTCGSAVSPKGCELLEALGVGDAVANESYAINGLRLVTPRGRDVTLSSPQDVALICNRRVLDHLLLQRAQQTGTRFFHLFESGRCAMAHANRKPIVDPDKPADLRRLSSELPIVRTLATRAIEEVFGVETRSTNFRKHLYELDGFKKILGPDIVDHLQSGTEPAGQPMLEIPDISIRIRRKDHYAPLEGLRCKHVGRDGKLFHMHFESLEGDVALRLSLDFGAERIQFDHFRDVGARDTGTAESAERVHEVKRFEQEYFGNGQLHIVNTDTGELIGRKDAYIPMNMYLDGDAAAAELARWKAFAEQRRARERIVRPIERFFPKYVGSCGERTRACMLQQ
jgi:hypothetical protein